MHHLNYEYSIQLEGWGGYPHVRYPCCTARNVADPNWLLEPNIFRASRERLHNITQKTFNNLNNIGHLPGAYSIAGLHPWILNPDEEGNLYQKM